jgi:hypothetical protein
MSEAVAQVLSSLNHLSQGERAELAYALLLSLGPEGRPLTSAGMVN